MSEISSSSSLGRCLLEVLHRGNELECRSLNRLEIRKERASDAFHRLETEVGDALDILLSLHGSDDRSSDAMSVPECVHQKALCDLHYQTCLDFFDGCVSDRFEDSRTKPLSRETDRDLKLPIWKLISTKITAITESFVTWTTVSIVMMAMIADWMMIRATNWTMTWTTT